MLLLVDCNIFLETGYNTPIAQLVDKNETKRRCVIIIEQGAATSL